jgi:hypothetical protein
MSCDWQADLMHLHANLKALDRQVGRDQYRHAVVQLEGDDLSGLGDVVPRMYASGYRLADRLVVRLPDGSLHAHFLFDDNMDEVDDGLLVGFRRELRGISGILSRVPKRTVPTIVVPSQGNGLVDDLLHWLYLLHWLAKRRDQSYFKSVVQYLPTVDDLRQGATFHAWDECCTLPDFDPVPFLTATASEKSMQEWRAEHEAVVSPLPAVISSSLTKPLLYASLNAIEMIVQAENAVPKARRAFTSTGNADIDMDADGLLVFLAKHHRTDGCVCDVPLTQAEIKRALQWSQSRVSRTVGKLFGNVVGYEGVRPMICYRRLCDTRRIGRELKRVWERRFGIKVDDASGDDIDFDKLSNRGF